MSRIGRLPITIPDNTTVTLENSVIKVTGPKGVLNVPLGRTVTVTIEDKTVVVTRHGEKKAQRSLHGTTRNLINNAIKGVTEGFNKNLELVGIGYRAVMEGKNIKLSLGYSHPVVVNEVPGITFNVDNQTKITVTGIDKQLVGQIAANIRELRPPEPYKGKGIKYENEVIIKKAGKTSKGE